MNSLICHFLSTVTNKEIIDLFNGCIKNPTSANDYALIYSSNNPQFYFIDSFGQNVQSNPDYTVAGFFTLDEINDNSLLQNKIQALRQIWCGS